MWRGEKVELGPVQREYLPKYVEWFNDWEMSRFMKPGMPRGLTLEDEIEWYERQAKDSNSIVFAILTLPEKKLIGDCGLHGIDLKNRTGIYGIFIGDKDYWGKGYGTDATRTLLRFAFEQLGLNRVELEVFDYNPRAVRAYEKAGFRRDGVRRQALYRDGEFHDIYLMGILRADWETNSGTV